MSDELDGRFLVLAPTGRDAPLTCSLLARAALSGQVCADATQLCREARRGAAGLLIAEEVLVPGAVQLIAALLSTQPPWSDLPILLFTGAGATIQARPPTVELLTPLGNVTLLDRPIRPITMISAARTAMRARRRQYAARSELIAREQALRDRDQFLAMLGHELRNPLSALLLAIDSMERGPRGQGEYREIMRRQGSHLARLVDDLLDVSRVTSGKVTLQRRSLDLGLLVERSVQAIDGKARAHAIDVEVEGELSPSVFVEGDVVRLEQVFGNLLTNAVKYTPPGGRVRVRLETSAERAIVRVRDDGVGISPEMLPRVFDLFAQAESTLDRSQGGLGIGLTLSRNLVDLHGGTIEATSEGVGKGSEFVVRLPLHAAEPTEERTTPRELTARDATRRVLIIEDNPDTRMLLQGLMETYGHHVDVAGDGVEGVARAIALEPEVLLVDIGLPSLDGYGVARQVRERLGKRVLLIAISGYGQPEDRARSIEAGFDLHLTKPFDPMSLIRAFRELAAGSTCT